MRGHRDALVAEPGACSPSRFEPLIVAVADTSPIAVPSLRRVPRIPLVVGWGYATIRPGRR